MIKTKKKHSLLPYLQAGVGKFSLRISLRPAKRDMNISSRRTSPFLSFNNREPWSRIISADLITDYGVPVQPLLLRMQRDEYAANALNIQPVNNRLVEMCWQRSFSENRENILADKHLLVAEQIDTTGKIYPLAPLFFCCLKSNYFHPPCPQCGAPAQQCEDDELLRLMGMPPFAESTRRYLYCPVCAETNDYITFYAHTRHENDPPFVLDRHELIKNFTQLSLKQSHAGQFPCPACDNHAKCYGAGTQALTNIHCLAFYPFYLQIYKADSLCASDLLALISGALPANINKETLADNILRLTNHLNNNDLFLTILYFKIKLLEKLISDLSRSIHLYQYPEQQATLDSIIVQMVKSPPSPHARDYYIHTDPITRHLTREFPAPPRLSAKALRVLGRLWLRGLTADSRHNSSFIEKTLKDHARQGNDQQPLLPPELIFWNPARKIVPEEHRVFWQKALHIGQYMCDSEAAATSRPTRRQLLKKISSLTLEICQARDNRPPDHQAEIHAILAKLEQKWRQPQEAGPEKSNSTKTRTALPNATTSDIQEKNTRPPNPWRTRANLTNLLTGKVNINRILPPKTKIRDHGTDQNSEITGQNKAMDEASSPKKGHS